MLVTIVVATYYLASRLLGVAFTLAGIRAIPKFEEPREKKKERIGIIVGAGFILFVPLLGELVLAIMLYGMATGIAERASIGPDKNEK